MKEIGIKTILGCSMMEIGGTVHELKMGWGLHPH